MRSAPSSAIRWTSKRSRLSRKFRAPARVGEGIAVTFASGLLYNCASDVVLADVAQNVRTLAASLTEYPYADVLVGLWS